MRYARLLLAAWLLLATAAAAALETPAPGQAQGLRPQALAGVLVLPAGTAGPVDLQGEWVVDWERFVDPHWLELPARSALAWAPGDWNQWPVAGKAPGPDGWGSYRLLVDCPPGDRMALQTANQRTAMRLYVNGVLVAEHGRPGPSAAETRAAVPNRIASSREFACPLRITAHVANWSHRAGGMVRPVQVGHPDALAASREGRLVQDVLLLGAYLVAALLAVVFSLVRRGDRVAPLFALFCVAMAVYADVTGGRLLLRLGPALVDWEVLVRIEYLAWLVAMATFFMTVRGLFPGEVHRSALWLVLGLAGASTVLVVATPARVYSQIAIPGQLLAVVIGIYVAGVMLLAQWRARLDAWVLLVGMAMPLLALATDLLLIDLAGPERRWMPVGFALFLLSPAVVLARRVQRTMQLEERSRALELNARLREDVERMARHDLKTPLNSILGASRLLLEDSRLAIEQREMASVVERAGLRMLDMVNLSLGLYRMETGSYDFRPQAVDLRELLARVLADLLPQADAAGVALRDPGPRAPVHARAEELLCYSILANLVKNAIEATPAGGTVTVQVLPGEPVRVTVHNPGVVPAELAPRFFDKYTSTGKTGGTGLGTYSARLMARAQGGELLLHTGSSEGTTLELQLQPLLRAAQLPAQPRVLPAPPAVGVDELQPRHVLVVDDDEFTRLVMRRYLPAPTFTVRVAASGEAAMDAIRAAAPQVLLLDIEMPGIGGLPVLAWLRQREARESSPRCAVVVTSAHDDELTRQRALASGADRYLVKPVSRDALWAALRELQDAAPRTGTAPVLPEAGPDDVVRIEPEWAELFPEFLAAQRRTVQEMRDALARGDRERLRALAHRAAGGLALGGLRWAASQARTLEDEAPTGDLPALVACVEGLAGHLAVVRTEVANAA